MTSKYETYGLEGVINECHSIAWDECHKIYILMDAEQTEKVKGYGYEFMTEMSYSDPYTMLETVVDWYDSSCSLKFIDVVYTENDTDEFYALVAQGESLHEVTY